MAAKRYGMAGWTASCLLMTGGLATSQADPVELSCPVDLPAQRSVPPLRVLPDSLPSPTLAVRDPLELPEAAPLPPFSEFEPLNDHLDPPHPSVLSDHLSFADRLQGLRSTSIVRLWDSHNLYVYLGVDRNGAYGLHFQRRASRDRQAAALVPSASGISSGIARTRFGGSRAP